MYSVYTKFTSLITTGVGRHRQRGGHGLPGHEVLSFWPLKLPKAGVEPNPPLEIEKWLGSPPCGMREPSPGKLPAYSFDYYHGNSQYNARDHQQICFCIARKETESSRIRFIQCFTSPMGARRNFSRGQNLMYWQNWPNFWRAAGANENFREFSAFLT